MIQKQIKKLIIASTNKGKLREIQNCLAKHPIEINPISEDFNCVEDADTFMGNAIKKAKEASILTGEFCLADDSGLSILSLGGRPGVLSARAFHNGKGMLDILFELAEREDRKAYFTSALALALNGEVVWSEECRWYGNIGYEIKGQNGFGYDPIFIPEGMNITAAEMEPKEKETLSHRGMSLKKFMEWLTTPQR